MIVSGAEFKVGDCIVVWWTPNRDMITKLSPYSGSLSYLFPTGAQLASFALNNCGMTIDNSDNFKVITKENI